MRGFDSVIYKQQMLVTWFMKLVLFTFTLVRQSDKQLRESEVLGVSGTVTQCLHREKRRHTGMFNKYNINSAHIA